VGLCFEVSMYFYLSFKEECGLTIREEEVGYEGAEECGNPFEDENLIDVNYELL
jgi:hypothetical protein